MSPNQFRFADAFDEMNTNTVPVLLENITVGCRVMVCGGFGNDPAREALVTEVSPDIKNGRPGIAYQLKNGDTRWAYLDQVVAIILPTNSRLIDAAQDMFKALEAVLAYHDSKFATNRQAAIEMARAAYTKAGGGKPETRYVEPAVSPEAAKRSAIWHNSL